MIMHFYVFLFFIWIFQFTEVDSSDKLKVWFEEHGLVWLENKDGAMYFQHLELPQGKITAASPLTYAPIAMGERFTQTFSHVDADVTGKVMVVVDTQTRSILAYAFQDNGQFTQWPLYEGISAKVNGIAVDWMTHVVYWTDAAYDVILGVAMEKPNMAEVIVSKGLDEPHSIVVYPQKGYMYWTDNAVTNPRVMTSNLGGRHVNVLFRLHNTRATSLTMDYGEERLYWSFEAFDGTSRGITSVHIFLKNSNITMMTSQPIQGLAYFNHQIATIESGQLRLYHVITGRNKAELTLHAFASVNVTGDPRDVIYLSPERQPFRHNTCELSKCPGLCTKSNYTEFCHCMHQDGERSLMCDPYSFTGIVFAKGDGLYTTKINFIEYEPRKFRKQIEPRQLLNTQYPIKALASDFHELRIFFYEYHTNILKSVDTFSDSEPSVISTAIGEISAIAVDTSTHNVYLSDRKLSHIMVTSGNGTFPYILHSGLNNPEALAVLPSRRYLFWSELGSRGLFRSSLDGTGRTDLTPQTLEIRSIAIYAIAVDYDYDILYLCDRNSVYSITWQGTELIRLFTGNDVGRFTGLSIVHDYLLVTDTTYRNGGVHVFDRAPPKGSSFRYLGTRYSGSRYGNWNGVTYHHVSAQPRRSSICDAPVARCDQLCLPGGARDATCVCSIGYIASGETCSIAQPHVPFLLLVDRKYRQLLQVNAALMAFVSIPVQGLDQPYAITFDPDRHMVYWSDLERATVSRAFLNGSHQEIVIYDPTIYVVDMAFDPGTRNLFYLTRDREHVHHLTIGGLRVHHVDTWKTLAILDRSLHEPHGLVLDVDNGLVFFTEQGHIWRMDSNGNQSQCIVRQVNSKFVARSENYVYFLNTTRSDSWYDEEQTAVMRSDLNGDNLTELFSLIGEVTSFTVGHDFIYWTNSSTRGIQRSRTSAPGTITNLGPQNELFLPSDLHINNLVERKESSCALLSCDGICLPTPSGPVCEEQVITRRIWDKVDPDLNAGHCKIPDIVNGDVLDNSPDHVVPNGYRATVTCYPLHTISSSHVITCINGHWTDVPFCKLDYDICGDSLRGYKVYRHSGHFFAYPERTKVEVICVGGGGGGYDVTDNVTRKLGKAGDGGSSSVGGYLFAHGGKGGQPAEGGLGGHGHSKGGDGSDWTGSCGTGGTAGQLTPSSNPMIPGRSYDLFCGSGGYSAECRDRMERLEALIDGTAGPGGRESNFRNLSVAGEFGGGAGGNGGGSGGGGGFSRLSITLPAQEVVKITVGAGGEPSFGRPSPGVVVVMWGDFRADDYVKDHDVINTCVPFSP